MKTKENIRKPPIGEVITRLTLIVTYLAMQGIFVKIFSLFAGKFWGLATDTLFTKGTLGHEKFETFI